MMARLQRIAQPSLLAVYGLSVILATRWGVLALYLTAGAV
jgi:hypothetical protein